MTRVATIVPAESDLLCEGCGYTLNGLRDDGNCPECGKPIVESRDAHRHPPPWETRRARASFWGFLSTSAWIIFRPTFFFRHTTSRGDAARAARFGWIHWALASVLFGLAGSFHSCLFHPGRRWWAINDGLAGRVGAVVLAVLTYLTLLGTTWAATRLTAWEAAYRGLRLPLPVVRRGMSYHAAHYLPVALLTLVTTAGYYFLYQSGKVPLTSIPTYLYVLCGEVIVFAAYLFKTYWIAMRNMLYANR